MLPYRKSFIESQWCLVLAGTEGEPITQKGMDAFNYKGFSLESKTRDQIHGEEILFPPQYSFVLSHCSLFASISVHPRQTVLPVVNLPARVLLLGDFLDPVHIRAECRRDLDAAVGLLVILEDRNPGPSNRQP